MDDKQFREMAEFEEKNDCTVMSPSLIQRLAGMDGTENILEVMPKLKQQFFYVVLQDRSGKIIDISHYDDYELALMRGMDKSKETGTYWSIYSLNSKFVDGNFNPK